MTTSDRLSFVERRERTVLLVIVLVALALRIGFSLTLENEFVFPDSERYHEVALNVLAGRGFVLGNAWPFLTLPDTHTGPYYAASPPGYSAFLAGCYMIAGDGMHFVRIVQAVIGAAMCLVVHRIASLLFGKKPACIAAALCAVYPFFVFFSGLVLSETLFLLLVCVFLMMLVMLADRPSFAIAAAAGALAAWATHVRSSFLLFPLAGLLVCLWRTADRKRYGACAACLIVSMCVCLAPWTLRNRRVLGHPVVTTTRGGMGLYEANGEGATGRTRLGDTPWPREIARMGEYERDAFLKAETRRIIMQDPVRFLGLAARKAGWMWNVVLNYERYRTTFYSIVSLCSYLPVMLLALAGALMARRTAGSWAVLLAPAVYLTAVHMVFIGSIRYRLPAMPFIIILSGYGLWMILSGERPTRAPQAATPSRRGTGRLSCSERRRTSCSSPDTPPCRP